MKHYLTDERIKEMQWHCETDTNFEEDGFFFWILINYGKGNHRVILGDSMLSKDKFTVHDTVYLLKKFSPDLIEINEYDEIYSDQIGWIDFDLKI